MQSNILDFISQQYNTMTRSSKKLADYIFTNKSMVQYMSITSLAEASGVSEATITRFCRGLGLAGYNEFKLALARVDHTTVTGDPTDTGAAVTDGDSFENVCRKLYQTDVKAMSETLELMDTDSTAKAVDLLSGARRVFCFGQGGSNVMAMEAWARFSTASSQFLHIEDSHMQAMAAALSTPDDVILFFSYSGATKDMLDVLRPARRRGAKIILVTHFAKSPAAAMADVTLLCGSKEGPLQSGSVAAKMGLLFIIDVLFNEYCRTNPALTEANREATAGAISAKLL